jgi:hypothetical protein
MGLRVRLIDQAILLWRLGDLAQPPELADALLQLRSRRRTTPYHRLKPRCLLVWPPDTWFIPQASAGTKRGVSAMLRVGSAKQLSPRRDIVTRITIFDTSCHVAMGCNKSNLQIVLVLDLREAGAALSARSVSASGWGEVHLYCQSLAGQRWINKGEKQRSKHQSIITA